MQIAEYYDSVASIWDDDYAEAKAARIVTAMVSIQRGGACVMDVGCGSGAMFADLMDGGACEIEGVDVSGEMIRLAQKKYGHDPRIHLTQADFLQLEQPGYAVIVSFNAYHHFSAAAREAYCCVPLWPRADEHARQHHAGRHCEAAAPGGGGSQTLAGILHDRLYL